MSRVAALHRELARLHAELAAELERAEPASDFVPESELQQVLGSRHTIRRLIKQGELVGSFSGRRIVVRRKDLDAFLATKRPRVKPQPTDDIDALLVKSGMRVLSGGRRG